SSTNSLGAWFKTISTCSSSASSSSQGEALKNWRGRRAMTLMSLPPRRRDERQQSIAVLPTPMMSTRSPTEFTWPKAMASSQAMPMWMLAAASLRPGMSRSLPRGTPGPTKTATHLSPAVRSFMLVTAEELLHAVPRRRVAAVDHHVGAHGDLFVAHALRQAEGGDVGAHEPAGLGQLLEDRDLVAERHEVVGDRELRGPGADADHAP